MERTCSLIYTTGTLLAHSIDENFSDLASGFTIVTACTLVGLSGRRYPAAILAEY